MNWAAFTLSLLTMLCYLLSWHVADAWLGERATTRAQRLLSSGLLLLVLLAMTIPVAYLLPDQSLSVQLGAATGIVLSGAIGAALRRTIRGHAN
jgi:hypothetical protein